MSTIKLVAKTQTATEPGQLPGLLNEHVRRPVKALVDEVAKVIVGKKSSLELVSVCILTEGAHILFEDLPGLAKSVMAATFAKAAGCQFKRIQFTPDLLPADITGTYVLNQKKGEFDFHPGPIFTNFLLADEINRASPKTQSALLEAMAEKQVSIEGTTHKLGKPFLVMATQNPVEQEGTYMLPEAQLDRFMIKTSVGHPNWHEEIEIMMRRNARKKDDFDVSPVTTSEQLLQAHRFVEEVFVKREIAEYIASIITATRANPEIAVGASPRGTLALLKLSKALAGLRGRAYVVPDDVRNLAIPVLAHRVILRPEARIQGKAPADVIQQMLNAIPVPKL